MSCKSGMLFLQPLRQKSKIFATSPYTGEALAASLTDWPLTEILRSGAETVKKAGYAKRLPCVKGAVSEAD